MEPVVVGRNVPTSAKASIPNAPGISPGAPPISFGTASSRYQVPGVRDPLPPLLYKSKLNKVISSRYGASSGIAIVCPSAPVGVLQLPKNGQKPISPKAEIEAARNTSSNAILRVTFSPHSVAYQRWADARKMLRHRKVRVSISVLTRTSMQISPRVDGFIRDFHFGLRSTV